MEAERDHLPKSKPESFFAPERKKLRKEEPDRDQDSHYMEAASLKSGQSPGEGPGTDEKHGLGRTYVPWNSEEEEALRLGVMKHGIGAWQIILRDPDFSILTIRQRTGIQLKDKWRNLVKFNHLSREESVLAAKNSERKYRKQNGRRPSDTGDGVTETGTRDQEVHRPSPKAATRPEPQLPPGSMPMPGSMGISSEAAARGLLGLQAQAYALGRLMPPADIEHAARFAMMHGMAPPPGHPMFEGVDPRAVMEGRRTSWGGGPPSLAERGYPEDGPRWPAVYPGMYPPGVFPPNAAPPPPSREGLPDAAPGPSSAARGGSAAASRSARKRSVSDADGPRDREHEREGAEEQWREPPAGFPGPNGYGPGGSGAGGRKGKGKGPPPSPYMEQAYLWQQWTRWSEMQMGALVEVRMLLAESLQLQSEADNSLLDMVVRCHTGSHPPEQLQHSIQICEMANEKVHQTYKLMDAWRRRVCSDAALDEPNLSAIPVLPRHMAEPPAAAAAAAAAAAHQRHLEELAHQRHYEAVAAAAAAAAAASGGCK